MDKSTLLSYMPNYYKTSIVIDNVNNANASELILFNTALVNTLNQFFVDTADYDLERWEKEFGIEINNNLDSDYRRSRIKAKLRGSGTITITLIKNVADSFTNGDVDVIEDNSNYQFTIKFTSVIGTPPNLQDLKNAIEQIKPAHLAVTYSYRYIIISEIQALTITQLQTKTLDKFAGGA